MNFNFTEVSVRPFWLAQLSKLPVTITDMAYVSNFKLKVARKFYFRK